VKQRGAIASMDPAAEGLPTLQTLGVAADTAAHDALESLLHLRLDTLVPAEVGGAVPLVDAAGAASRAVKASRPPYLLPDLPALEAVTLGTGVRLPPEPEKALHDEARNMFRRFHSWTPSRGISGAAEVVADSAPAHEADNATLQLYLALRMYQDEPQDPCSLARNSELGAGRLEEEVDEEPAGGGAGGGPRKKRGRNMYIISVD
jgi:hypothetical protein